MSVTPSPPAAQIRTRPGRRRLDAATRRETILDAAIPLFANAGYEQTRVSDVAARVGVTEPVIFQNFGTKSELFAAALERVAAEAATYLANQAAEHTTILEWLRHLLSSEHLDHLHTAPMFGVLFADAHRLQLEAGISAALHRSATRAAEVMAGILQRGQADGSIRADVQPLTLAWLVVSLIQARQFRRTHAPEPSAALEADLLAGILETFRP
jgi:AcrR family transcriptional regulator